MHFETIDYQIHMTIRHRFFTLTLGSAFLLFSTMLSGQSFWFGPKVAGALTFQQWNNFSPNPLFRPAYDFFVETYSETSSSALYASLGYHTRGSGIRTTSFFGDPLGTQGFKFNNIVLELGGKRFLSLDKAFNAYYMIGVRGEYTVSTNLKEYERFLNPFYPHNDFVKKVVYGATVGGGFEYTFGDLYRGFLEVAISPDFANQYFQPPINNVIDPFTGMTTNLSERQIRNVSIEIRAGLKLLRKVIYE